jgi:hypothetical protein
MVLQVYLYRKIKIVQPMRFIATLLLCFSLFSCSRYAYLPEDGQPNAEITYRDGKPVLYTDLGDLDAYLDLYAYGASYMDLILSVQNQSEASVTFNPEDVRVTGFNAEGRPRKFKVFSADGYIRHINTRNAVIVGAVAVAVVAVAVSTSSSGSRSSRSGGGELNNNCHNYFWLDAGSSVLVNTAINNSYTTPRDGLLRKHTLESGEGLQGVIKIQGNNAYTHRIRVEIPTSDGGTLSYLYDRKTRVRR